jgi:hypothetical protein
MGVNMFRGLPEPFDFKKALFQIEGAAKIKRRGAVLVHLELGRVVQPFARFTLLVIM